MTLYLLFDNYRYKPEAYEPALFFQDFFTWLNEELNYEVGYLNGEITLKNISDWDVFFIFSPGEKLPYSQKEANILSQWIREGGVLIITRPTRDSEKLNYLAEHFGLKFTSQKADSYAFFVDVSDRLLKEYPERFSKYKRILANHSINRGLKAVAEGLPKSKLRPYFIEVSGDWNIIGASLKNNEAKPVAAIRDYGNGLILALGVIYLFYMWRSWLKNEELEKREDAFLSNVTFVRRIFNFIESHVKKLERNQK